MARPVEFEYDFVLSNAMKQFWKEGFEASSIQKLLDATNINRGTLYNSFGDKDAFFKSCIDTYNTETKTKLESTLGDKKLKPLDAIAAYFDVAIISAPNKQRTLGCLLVNSVCESINWDKDMQKVLRNSLNTIRKAILGRCKELEKAKQLKKALNADIAADLLMNALHGLRVNSRNGKATKQMAEIVSFTLASIKK